MVWFWPRIRVGPLESIAVQCALGNEVALGGGGVGFELDAVAKEISANCSQICVKKIIIFPKLKILIVKFLVRKQENILT